MNLIKQFGLTLILILLCGSLAWFLSYPAYLSWGSGQRQLNNLENELTALAKKQSLVSELERNNAQISEAATLATNLIPAQENRETFISELDSIAQATGVNLITITFTSTGGVAKAAPKDEEGAAKVATPTKKTKAPANQLKTVAFKLGVVGNYSNVLEFIHRLSQAGRYNTIGQFSLAGNEAEAQISINLSLDGLIYTKPIPAAPKNPAFGFKAINPLIERLTKPAIVQTTGRTDPFAKY